MKQEYFSTLLPELAVRAARATVGRLGFSSPPLRRFLFERFAEPFGHPGSFLGDPVFEATYGWATNEKTMEQLAEDLLTPSLVVAMDQPPEGQRSEYRFAKTTKPYVHQVDAWRSLAQTPPRSIVVTSGTGSGKTECFLVPILDQLFREWETDGRKLVGVRALMLYPLNALINSQRDRLLAWTNATGQGVRFCLYNGLTPDVVPQHKRAETPNQVVDRETLRQSPPPILVTNATMLEYMLVRAQDAPIIDASRGKLGWIVLDEAHTYLGSQAAELALLLRRVLIAFEVKATDVRFVATSATIGEAGENGREDLRRFIAGLAGVGLDRVEVIEGARNVPPMDPKGESHVESSLEELSRIEPELECSELRYDALLKNKTARRLRECFIPAGLAPNAQQLSSIMATLWGGGELSASRLQVETLQWLDLLSSTSRRSKDGRSPFLPLRAHLFHRVMSGLWACADAQCPGKAGTPLESGSWPFGLVYEDGQRTCVCGSPVFELRTCGECNEAVLWSELRSRNGQDFLAHPVIDDDDGFSLDAEVEDSGESAEEGEDDTVETASRLLICAPGARVAEVLLARRSLELEPGSESDTIRIFVREQVAGQPVDCPSCASHYGDGRELFRRAVLGAPFLLGQVIPTLLEYCPDGDEPMQKPARGRRLISFTDSRQGTARVAAKIQQESERNRLRGLVYARVAIADKADSGQLDRLKRQLHDLKSIQEPPESLLTLISDLEARIKEHSSPRALPFDDLAESLAANELDVRRMLDYYVDLDPAIFDGVSGAKTLSRMALAREFARRPKRANSLETMGLVSVVYPKLLQVNAAPEGVTLDEWRSFLKLSLDFYVRENTIVDLPEHWRKWGGNLIARKWVLPPLTDEQATTQLRRWPQCRRGGGQSRLARLLAFVLRQDLASDHGKDLVDLMLRRAWDDLVACGLLAAAGTGGRYLQFADMAFRKLERAWVCPVTRRVLDTTLRGVTPYLPASNPRDETARCAEIQIPVCPVLDLDFASERDRVHAIRQWLETTPAIADLRIEGLWSDLSDRVVEGATYLRAAEHSAQQPAERLQRYEGLFKQGRLNLLSCSTTMEMGVDIGGVSMVAMNNVPPHPSNYLQRAGRAGRRGESRSVAMTVCKNNPHDEHVFQGTRWPFDFRPPMPRISLSSVTIVQRHVQSLLLSSFLRRRVTTSDVDLNKLTCEWFFVSPESSIADEFVAWCEAFQPANDPALSGSLKTLVRGTCFDGMASVAALAISAAQALRALRDRWLLEYRAIEAQLGAFETQAQQNDPAFKALTLQRKRVGGEYLLTELAGGGFLPGYGFPTNIVSFDTLTAEELKRKARQGRHREDNLYRRRDLASRDAVTALREYAPGAEIVIDGLVYRSSGITLNWHTPASVVEVNEIQSIRVAWRCSSCGASGTRTRSQGDQCCDECGVALSPTNQRVFLEPNGFAVDFYSEAHNDVTRQLYVPVQGPWIHAGGEWMPLSNPTMGRFRATENGTVFHHSSGVNGTGFAVCLACGRSEPMPDPASGEALPRVFQAPHWRLRGSRGDAGAHCTGSHNQWAIKPSLHLGHEFRTDVLELQLKGLDGLYLDSRTAAFTLAVALREAGAQMLGVESLEMGCDVKEVREDGQGKCTAIILYDINASGYVTSLVNRIPELLRGAARALECPNDCGSSCNACLLSYGTRFRQDDLDRHVGLSVLNEQWLNHLKLPPELGYFGAEDSVAEYQELPEAIWRELERASATKLQVMLGGDPARWDLAASPLKRHLYRWMATEKQVSLVIAKSAFDALAEGEREALARLVEDGVVEVLLSQSALRAGQGWEIARIEGEAGNVVAWGAAGELIQVPDSVWGRWPSAVVVRGRSKGRLDVDLEHVTATQIAVRRHEEGSAELTISTQLDGPCQSFGERLWVLVQGAHPASRDLLSGKGGRIVSIDYRDRYLHAPLPCALLLDVIGALQNLVGDNWDGRKVKVVTTAVDPIVHRVTSRGMIWSDWENSRDRDTALARAFNYRRIDCDVVTLTKTAAAHARTLEVRFDDGQVLRLRFDQGLSYWRVTTSAQSRVAAPRFDFSASSAIQGERLATLAAHVAGQSYPTYLTATVLHGKAT